MQIRKTYQEVNPELLYNEVRDFVVKQGAVISDSKMETYSLPNDSSSSITHGALTFKMSGKDCLSAHVLGSARGETRLLMDVDDKVFPPDKLSAMQSDLDFMLGLYEVKSG